MEKTKLIKVANRESAYVGYTVPELGVYRSFAPREQKEITFEELEKLSWTAGGTEILKEYLVIRDEEAASLLIPGIEPEYYYTAKDINRMLTTASMNEFLDCLDFAPIGVLESLKDAAVMLPLDNMSKRKAILEKLNFDVTRAIEIKDTKFDGDTSEEEQAAAAPKRRVAIEPTTSTGRRTATPKYTVVQPDDLNE